MGVTALLWTVLGRVEVVAGGLLVAGALLAVVFARPGDR